MASIRDEAGRVADWLRTLQEPVRVVSHFDADGLCGSAIITAALKRLGLSHELCILPVLTADAIARLATEEFRHHLFIDVGSAHAATIAGKFEDWFVIDHHKAPVGDGHLNPWRFDLDGGRDACSSTLCYLVARELDPQNTDLSGIALVGMLADSQEKQGIVGVNRETLDDAQDAGIVASEERLRLFGYERHDLYTLMLKSSDLRIPGVTGDPEGVRRFLDELGLDGRARFSELTQHEKDELLELGKARASRTPATVLHLTLLKEHNMFRDARQYATVLNACGRLERAELAMGILRDDREARYKARRVLDEYRDELRRAHEWHREHEAERGDGFLIIDAGDAILPSIIGTLCSTLTRSGEVEQDTIVLGLAAQDGALKVSARVNDHSARDVLQVLQRACEGLDCQVGGHRVAAGALVRNEDKEEFLENARRELAASE